MEHFTSTPVPKLIHQIWFQGKVNAPEYLIEHHNLWLQKHPNYRFIFWDQSSIENLINDIDTPDLIWIKDTYFSFKLLIQKIDFAKYIILYVYGGIYLDLDIKCLKSLDNLLQSKDLTNKNIILSSLTYDFGQRVIIFLSGHFNTSNLVNNGIIMAAPKHPFILDLMIRVNKSKNNYYKYVNNSLYIFYSTGPIVLSKTVSKYINNPDTPNDIHILDQSYFEACDVHTVKRNCKVPENAIGLHIYEGSWISNQERKILDFYYNLKRDIFMIILIFIIIYYFFR